MKFNKLIYSCLLFFVLFTISCFKPASKPLDDLALRDKWVDSMFSIMNEDETLGQLFMVAAYSNRDNTHVEGIEELITKYNIGGVIFFQGGPVRQALLTNRYQAKAKVPLYVAMDAEWGLSMRLDSTVGYPKQMTLGAIKDNQYIYKMGKEIARQCRRLGVHINFAPVIDINSNPNNPVIGMRSFGENKYKVADKGLAYTLGMQDLKVMANAKHFPGHGDTESDSHLSLPIINYDEKRLNDIELYPFKKLFEGGVKSVMVAHIHVPVYDNTKNMATTLSLNAVTNKLKGELGFKGLVFTDALNMKGVSSYYKPGEVELKALLAGNDVLLFAEDVPLSIQKIKKAITDGEITKDEVYGRVRKILEAKYWSELHLQKPVVLENLYEDLTDSWAKSVRWELYSKAITLVQNKNKLLPVQQVDNKKMASLVIGDKPSSKFQSMLSNYAKVDHYNVADKSFANTDMASLIKTLNSYDVVYMAIANTNIFNSKNFGISDKTKEFINALPVELKNKTILTVFGNPYSLKLFTSMPQLICGYEDTDATQSIVPQMIFGALPMSGTIPITATPELKEGAGLEINTTLKRLTYSYPELVNMDNKTLCRIDTLMERAIKEGMMPGGQVFIVKNGNVVYNKSFGYLDYSRTTPVTNSTVYDLASVTKVAATTQAAMFLEERGLIDIHAKVEDYLPELKGTNKGDLIINDVMSHQAGLIPFIPHWRRTVDSTGFMKVYYDTVKSEAYPNAVAKNLYSMKAMEDSVWKWSVESPLLPKPKKAKHNWHYHYTYSDIGFYIMRKIVERITNQPIDEFMSQNFYEPLGLGPFYYKPLEKQSIDNIAPTENDVYYRKQLIQGYVHDQGAAMIGGVSGHAGLFGTATGLGTLMQMNLQGGEYGGSRYLMPETITKFSTPHNKGNRRGLGWDKPDKGHQGPTSYLASSKTYGHTGFTGTAVWVDPTQEIVYVFISNRVNPDAANNRLNKNNIRPFIQTLIYKSVLNYKAPF